MNNITTDTSLYTLFNGLSSLPQTVTDGLYTCLICLGLLLAGWLIYSFSQKIIGKMLTTFSRLTPTKIDDFLADTKLHGYLARILAGLILSAIATIKLVHHQWLFTFINKGLTVYLYLNGLFLFSLLLDLGKQQFDQSAMAKQLSIDAFIQVGKLVASVVVAILLISLIINQSPLYILSGIGALTAVLIIVFKDTLLGLVAGFQLAANRMIRNGDWIELDQYGADGTVVEVGLTSVKIKNFDNTISTVPTYELVNKPVKNWRGMEESDGRRIKRSLNIDLHSVEFLTAEDIQRLQTLTPLADYTNEKLSQLQSSNEDKTDCDLNTRRLTNLGTFRAYMEHYLRHHDKINQQLTLMVRQLEPTGQGIPLQVYCFCSDKTWVSYEHIQADIFDHFISMLDTFELRAFQHVTYINNKS